MFKALHVMHVPCRIARSREMSNRVGRTHNASTYWASFRLRLQDNTISCVINTFKECFVTHVHSAYRNPPKQNAAISIKATNCTIMARNASTIKLFLSVTKARLGPSVSCVAVNGYNDVVPRKHEDSYQSEKVDARRASPVSCEVVRLGGQARSRVTNYSGICRIILGQRMCRRESLKIDE